jgi:hypothetical protein
MTPAIPKHDVARCKCGSNVYMTLLAGIRVALEPNGREHQCVKRPKR